MDNMPSVDSAIPDEKRADSDSQRGWLTRNWMWLAGVLLVLFVLSRVTLHRGYIEDDKRFATRLIAQFHQRMNAGQLDQIYDAYDQSLKNVKTREEELQSLREVSSQFGAFKSVADSEMNVIVEVPMTQVRAAYNSNFEKGDVTELFAFVRRGHDLKLAFYQVSPGTAKLEWGHDLEAAQKAAETVHKEISTGDYDAIYDGLSDDLKTTTSREQIRDLFQGINDKFGTCEAASLVDSSYTTNNEGHFVELQYTRKCTNGELRERLAFKVVDGKALLRGYH